MRRATGSRLALLATTPPVLGLGLVVALLGGALGTGVGTPEPAERDVAAAAAGAIAPASIPDVLAAEAASPAPAAVPSPPAEPLATSPAEPETPEQPDEPGVARTWTGVASWYGPGLEGLTTASGERFDSSRLTAAHKELPLGSLVRVTYDRTGRSVVVRINDRGPWVRGREIDLARAAAEVIGLRRAGHGLVTIELLR